ncbi:ArsR/SmtB family transcription factor [Streptomyces nojiriensis]|uniref:ArsR/SmtB family transcription factor n=1 Tax=Streptomyces nojiriensis TaxID=66374 RepID=UPI00365DB608
MDIPVSVSVQPGMSVISLLADTFGMPQGVPVNLRRSLRAVSPGYLSNAAGTLTSTGSFHIPSLLWMRGDAGGESIRHETQRIAETAPEALLADIDRMYDGKVPLIWRKVVDSPSTFLLAYAAMARAVWKQLSGTWQRSKPLLEREIGRIGVASVTGAMASVLADLSPRISFADGNLVLPANTPVAAPVALRRLTLTPLVSGTRACVARVDADGHAHIGYPLAGLARLLRGTDGEERTPSDPLALTLGELRAVILRKGTQSVSMGTLADLLHCTAGTVTYHCRQLEQAGLLCRERQGREVRICRTLRGDALVDALS